MTQSLRAKEHAALSAEQQATADRYAKEPYSTRKRALLHPKKGPVKLRCACRSVGLHQRLQTALGENEANVQVSPLLSSRCIASISSHLISSSWLFMASHLMASRRISIPLIASHRIYLVSS